jgi:ubiquitin-protein ligase
MPDRAQTRRIFIEAPSGERFEADVPLDVKFGKLAGDFFESQGWPTQDRRGRGQRAVVELVNPNDPDDTKRLNASHTIDEAGIREGDVLRIFPESIAGAVDYSARIRTLIADHNEMQALSERTPNITFTTNRNHAPDRYELTFHYPSFVEYYPGQSQPRISEEHKVEIVLAADYPRRAPIVTWMTPVFHPNIKQPEGAVCLGVLADRYLPGLGLARLVTMLSEMVQWRNFDALNPFNREAANWATNPDNWPIIQSIGGHPLQGPIEQLLKEFDRSSHPRIEFRRLTPAE